MLLYSRIIDIVWLYRAQQSQRGGGLLHAHGDYYLPLWRLDEVDEGHSSLWILLRFFQAFSI